LKITSFEDFKAKAQPKTRLPIVCEISNDFETPVALYSHFLKEKYHFLFESLQGGEKWGRYSFIGLDPSLILSGRTLSPPETPIWTQKSHRSLRSPGQNKSVPVDTHSLLLGEGQDPLQVLKAELGRYRSVKTDELSRFGGGAVGFVSYECVRFFETKIPSLQNTLKIPDLCFFVPQILLITDNFNQSLKIVYDARIDNIKDVKKEYERGVQKIKKIIQKIKKPFQSVASKKTKFIPKWKESLGQKAYQEAVEKIREYIVAGDITQTVLSNRFETKGSVPSFEVYRALRRINPSPYLFHFQFGDDVLVGASPETMVRLEKGEMTLRPIAGTRPRGKTEKEDHELEKELLADPKERAEHVMLVDLGRNDLGRVAEKGSVKVDELMTVERYSHVMHIVSNVRAKLEKGKDMFDVLRATFPAGTLSGSPKVRAMQIIEEIEPVRRGPYGGCIGYFDFSGNMDMAITIRSVFFHKGKIYIQAGAGIVADSEPEKEYQEVCNKARAMMKAVELC